MIAGASQQQEARTFLISALSLLKEKSQVFPWIAELGWLWFCAGHTSDATAIDRILVALLPCAKDLGKPESWSSLALLLHATGHQTVIKEWVVRQGLTSSRRPTPPFREHQSAVIQAITLHRLGFPEGHMLAQQLHEHLAETSERWVLQSLMLLHAAFGNETKLASSMTAFVFKLAETSEDRDDFCRPMSAALSEVLAYTEPGAEQLVLTTFDTVLKKVGSQRWSPDWIDHLFRETLFIVCIVNSKSFFAVLRIIPSLLKITSTCDWSYVIIPDVLARTTSMNRLREALAIFDHFAAKGNELCADYHLEPVFHASCQAQDWELCRKIAERCPNQESSRGMLLLALAQAQRKRGNQAEADQLIREALRCKRSASTHRVPFLLALSAASHNPLDPGNLQYLTAVS